MPAIHEAMSKILSDLEGIAKSRRNQQQGYSFRGIDDFFNAAHPLLAQYGVFVTPDYEILREDERPTSRGGTLFVVKLKGTFTFYATDGSTVTASTIGEGMDSGDKASNKAMSAAYKYALMQAFCVPTGDAVDSENDSPEPTYRPPAKKPDTSANRFYNKPKKPDLRAMKMALLSKVMQSLQTDKEGAVTAIQATQDRLGVDTNTQDGLEAIENDLFQEPESTEG